jgi:hypothetical protein
MLRRIIEALFITHGETNLNNAHQLVANSNNSKDKANTSFQPWSNNRLWCAHLVRRPLPSMANTAKSKSKQ